jgi:hypothetical protein
LDLKQYLSILVQDPELQDLPMYFDDYEGANPNPSLLQPIVIPDDNASDLKAGKKLDQDALQIRNQGIPIVKNDEIQEIVVDDVDVGENETEKDQNSWLLKKYSARPINWKGKCEDWTLCLTH